MELNDTDDSDGRSSSEIYNDCSGGDPKFRVEEVRNMLINSQIDKDIAQMIAEYIVIEKDCQLGEDPILLVHSLPVLDTLVHPGNPQGVAGNNAALVVEALERAAGGAQNNIRGKNVAFHFRSHQLLIEARRNLSNPTLGGNIGFAFNVGPQLAMTLAQTGHPVGNMLLTPKLETAIVTNLSPQERSISHDDYDFFHFP